MDYYHVLGLSEPNVTQEPVSTHALRQAYRRALLTHHPDKAGVVEETVQDPSSVRPSSAHAPTTGASKPTIDEITTAYQKLSDPKARAEHDRELRLRPQAEQGERQKFRTGLDTVDLDDLIYEDSIKGWYRACRCGQEKGYFVTEQQLEEVADLGEIVVGCRGCSLWLKVLFSVATE